MTEKICDTMGNPETEAALQRARRLCQQYNQIPADRPADLAAFLEDFLDHVGDGSSIQQPFQCDRGDRITVGENVFINYNCTILDIAQVTIGDNTMIGPNVGIYTAAHPLSPGQRLAGACWASPVVIGKNVWIGGSVIILPGVTVGDNAVIGAGSVVTKDVPPNMVAVGSPARIVGPTGD